MTGAPIDQALLFATAAVSLKMESPGPTARHRGPDVNRYIEEFYR